MSTTVLVIDDEAPIRQVVRLYLAREGFVVIEAGDGENGLHLALEHRPDVIVLDLLLPGRDGWSVCQELVSRTSVPILILTARDDETDVVLGLGLGADDYLTKPFRPAELVARIKALRRRVDGRRQVPAGAERFEFADFSIDRHARELMVRGQPAPCPGKEFDLLWLLVSSPRRVFSRRELLAAVWGGAEFIDPRTVDTHIHRLRERVEPQPARPRYIRTVWGVGYRFFGETRDEPGR